MSYAILNAFAVLPACQKTLAGLQKLGAPKDPSDRVQRLAALAEYVTKNQIERPEIAVSADDFWIIRDFMNFT